MKPTIFSLFFLLSLFPISSFAHSGSNIGGGNNGSEYIQWSQEEINILLDKQKAAKASLNSISGAKEATKQLIIGLKEALSHQKEKSNTSMAIEETLSLAESLSATGDQSSRLNTYRIIDSAITFIMTEVKNETDITTLAKKQLHFILSTSFVNNENEFYPKGNSASTIKTTLRFIKMAKNALQQLPEESKNPGTIEGLDLLEKKLTSYDLNNLSAFGEDLSEREVINAIGKEVKALLETL